MIAEDGAYRGACCAEMLTTKCEHLDDVTVYSNWDEGVTEMRCNECNCTWETVIE